jgi:WD40 repeat protein
VLHGHAGPVSSAGYSPDGSRIVSSGADGTIRLWSTATGEAEVLRRGARAWAVAYSADGAWITATNESGISILDPAIPSTAEPTFAAWLATATNAEVDAEGRIGGAQ